MSSSLRGVNVGSRLLRLQNISRIPPASDKVVGPQWILLPCNQPSRGLFGLKLRGSKASTAMLSRGTDPDYRERFIPITRRSLIRHLMQEPDLLTEAELKKFEQLALALDTTLLNRYHGILQELKTLFDPIDPDKDTISTRQFNRKQRMDTEFWLLQKLSHVMEKANFHKLSRPTVDAALTEKTSREGVVVSVNRDNYDALHMWALGKETPELDIPWYTKLAYKAIRRPLPTAQQYYKRVVVAVRLKKDDKLILKAFKEVPVNSLEQLLPDGKIKMSGLDKTLVWSSMSIMGFGLIAKIVSTLAQVYIDWTVLLAAVGGLTATRAWTVYKNRRNAYLVELSRLLYFRNVANNRGLLTLLVDRAEDELFKECLLVYTFLLSQRPPSQQTELTGGGGLSIEGLEAAVQDWVQLKTGAAVSFESTEALRLLQELGMAEEQEDGVLRVVGLQAALAALPITPQSLIDRAAEFEQLEGYDRAAMGDDYEEEQKTRRSYGWR